MNEFLNDAYQIAAYIKNAEKKTPVKVYMKGQMDFIDFSTVKSYGDSNFKIVFGNYAEVKQLLDTYKDVITDFDLEYDRRNSAIPLLNTTELQARIEPGAYIREFATIKKDVVVMMGAVINIGAVIGEKTMIDMNAVVGARAIIGERCHIGAGAVVAGVLEPPSKTPVIIEDDVLVGANAVILEGVHIGKGAVVAAGAVVTHDVLENEVVAGSPAKVIKVKDEKTIQKTQILDDLRK